MLVQVQVLSPAIVTAIVAVLSCFDRVIFKGYLPITNRSALEGFVDHILKIRRCDFMDFAEEQSESLVDHANRLAQEAGAEYHYLQGPHRKDKLVDKLLRQRPISEGLICVLCCKECRPSFKLAHAKDRPRLVNARRPQRVLYFYFLDADLELIHIRLTTWFPFILTFLGRRFHPRFDGEVLTHCQKGRWPGARIIHRMKNNWLKMYDKFALVLRIETVINNPREFRVRRLRTRDGRRQMVWCPMNKGVINLYRYREVSLAANERYLEALAVVEDVAPAYRQVEELTEPVVASGRSHAGFNPASGADVKLFSAVLDGNHLVRGFRNADIREALYESIDEAGERRLRSHAVGRMLKRLHVRGLIVKVPHSRRWLVSRKGHQVLGAVVRLYHYGIPASLGRGA